METLKSYTRKAERCGTPALGQGSSGSVHRFLMGEEKTVVAGKIYRLPSPDDIKKYVCSHVKILTILFNLKHENIVFFYGVSFLSNEEFPVLLMECCKQNLAAFLTGCPKSTISTKETISRKLGILRGVANGLNYLHNLKPAIVHRDLTARNILLDEHLTAKIADFGQAKRLTHDGIPMTMTAMSGNSFHLPPEASERKYDEKIDIFSFGHLSIFTITQEAIESLPSYTKFDSETGNTVSVSELERRQSHISTIATIVGNSHSIIEIIKKCLKNHPPKRPSASDLLRMFPAEKRLGMCFQM